MQSNSHNKRSDMLCLFKMYMVIPKDEWFDRLHNDMPIAHTLCKEDHEHWTGNN